MVYAVQQKTDMMTLGLLQRGTPDMDGVPGVTQVSWGFISLCHAYACLVSNPASRKFHLSLLYSWRIRILLVPFSLSSLLR